VYHVLNRSVAGLPQFFHSLAAPRRSAVEADGESEERAASPFRPPPFQAPVRVSTHAFDAVAGVAFQHAQNLGRIRELQNLGGQYRVRLAW
jgi:hypothetical protein